jgi:hypothetical protein
MMPLLAISLVDVPFLAGVALLTWILLKRSYRYFGRRRNKNPAPLERQPRPTSKWDGVQRDALAQVERQKVEMHEMTRDLNGQLSSKIIILEQLISDSQQQIDRLEHLLDRAEQSSPIKQMTNDE